MPPVLPGRGGFFDADLEILYNGGINGSNVVPMFDCTVTGGSLLLSFPLGPRQFICSGNDGEVARTVDGRLIPLNAPYAVTVSDTRTSVVDSKRPSFARLLGASPLHTGYLEWDITSANMSTDQYRLSLPPVLPGRGGYFDADLEILYNGGTDGTAPSTELTRRHRAQPALQRT